MKMTFNDLRKNLKKDITGLPEIKISVVGDTSTQFLSTAIRGEGIGRGFHIFLSIIR